MTEEEALQHFYKVLDQFSSVQGSKKLREAINTVAAIKKKKDRLEETIQTILIAGLKVVKTPPYMR